MKTIGQKIEFLREEKKITQDVLARVIGVSPAAVSKWEQDISKPKAESSIKLSEYFNVKLSSLTKHDEIIHYKQSLISVPFYSKVQASAGNGIENYDENVDEICIQASFIRNPKTTVAINILGDSMAPVFLDGAIAFIDKSELSVVDGQVYVFIQDNLVRMKILENTPKGYKLKSYNINYPVESVNVNIDYIKIIGKVVAQIQTY